MTDADGRWRLAIGIIAAGTSGGRGLGTVLGRRRRPGPALGEPACPGAGQRRFAGRSGVSITSGAYFAYAPDTAQAAGLATWIGPAMWAVLGATGAAVGMFGGGIADRFGLRWPLVVMLVLVGGSPLVLLMAPGALPAVLASAALFGVGFATGFALLAIWSQRGFHERPTAGFTVDIVFIAIGFIIGPSLLGVLATHTNRAAALVAAALPALLVALVPPSRDDRLGAEGRDHQDDDTEPSEPTAPR